MLRVYSHATDKHLFVNIFLSVETKANILYFVPPSILKPFHDDRVKHWTPRSFAVIIIF